MTRIPTNLLPWFEARKRFKLSHAQTQMARELGMNPRKLGKLANEKQALWKLPLPEFIAKAIVATREAPAQEGEAPGRVRLRPNRGLTRCRAYDVTPYRIDPPVDRGIHEGSRHKAR
jgi:hypothetical protein